MTIDGPQDSPSWPPTPSRPPTPSWPPTPSASPPAATGPAPAHPAFPAGGYPQDAPSDAGSERIWTIMSETKRRGDWRIPSRLVLPVALGDVYLDLREAQLTAPTTIIEVQGLMGEVKVVVPDSVRVECSGSAIMGEFGDLEAGTAGPPPPTAPVVRVVGAMIMGQVRVFRTSAPVGTGPFAIDGMAGWKHERRARRERRRVRGSRRDQS